MRQVANAAFFGRHGENFSARREDGALAIGSDVKVRNVMAGVDPVLHRLVAFAVQVDRQLLRLLALKIEGVKIAAILKNNCVRPHARPHAIEIGELRQLLYLLCFPCRSCKYSADARARDPT